MEKREVTLLGAGLVGSLMAVYLCKQGYKVTLHERRPDMRKTDISAGRSINLALSDRGWQGLQGAGLDQFIRDNAIPMHGRQVHAPDGTQNFQRYGKEGQAIYSISRRDINCLLMDAAERNGAIIRFDETITKVDLETNTIVINNNQTKKTEEKTCNFIMGSDGAYSPSRLPMQFTEKFNYSQQYLEHGYKELCIEAGYEGNFVIEKNALHIWPRGGYMLIALPNPDGSFTCTLFFPHKGDTSFEALQTEEDVLKFFNQQFPDAVPLMPNLTKDFFQNPTGALMTVRCAPWTFRNRMLLIGDAAHAIVPFYGQGMNCGFEDCFTLNELITKHDHNWEHICKEYEQKRKPAGDGIAELALNNFIEMRDLVNDEQFLLRKKIEGAFFAKHPDKWMPLYSMVSFSHIPYNEALAVSKKQDVIMNELLQIPDVKNKFDSDEVMSRMMELVVAKL
ncbi:MAG: FAD-dependent monooxygenase [Bacteroidetes bacterium]|nr:FAD-dependent monooxygenase [Bacteroidota bacterium]